MFDILTTSKAVPPFLAAFWRLFIQNTVQLVPFLWTLFQQRRKDRETEMMRYHDRELALEPSNQSAENGVENTGNKEEQIEEPLLSRYLKSLPLCIISGIFLGIHFSMWVFSLRYTSLTHSLLWVSMGPIVLNGGAWILYLLGQNQCIGGTAFASTFAFILQVRRPSAMETTGVLVGISGAIIMLIGVKGGMNINIDGNGNTKGIGVGNGNTIISSNHEPTLYGDAAAFSGAVAVCVYLIIGQKLRKFLPIWLYVFPVIGAATLTCLLFSFLDARDPSTLYGMTRSSVFGFLSKDFFFYALYLGVGPGICGHTLLNALLKHVSPLIISTSMLMEPILGSIIGYFCGLQPLPDLSTWIGGGVLMTGLVLVVMGENESDRRHEGAVRNEEEDVETKMNLKEDFDKLSYGTVKD